MTTSNHKPFPQVAVGKTQVPILERMRLSELAINRVGEAGTRVNVTAGTADATAATAAANALTAIADAAAAQLSAQAAQATANAANSNANTRVPQTRSLTIAGTAQDLSADRTFSPTTANIPDSANARYCTDAQKIVIGNTSGANTGDETTTTIKTKLGAATDVADGYLTAADHTTFNGKQAALGFTPVNKVGDTMTGPLVTSMVTPSRTLTDMGSGRSAVETLSATNNEFSLTNQTMLAMGANCKVLLHLDSNFTDSSTSAHAFTGHGAIAVSATAPKFGAGSLYFHYSSSQYIDTPNTADFNVAAGDFTLHFWHKRNDSARLGRLCGQTDSGFAGANTSIVCDFTADDYFNFRYCVGGAFTATTSNITIADTAWHHYSIVRNGNNLFIFIDGIMVAFRNVTGVTINTSTNTFSIGRAGEFNGQYGEGYINEFYFNKGTALWTNNFIPPTQPYGTVTTGKVIDAQDSNVDLGLAKLGDNGFTTVMNGDKLLFQINGTTVMWMNSSGALFIGNGAQQVDSNAVVNTVPGLHIIAPGSLQFSIKSTTAGVQELFNRISTAYSAVLGYYTNDVQKFWIGLKPSTDNFSLRRAASINDFTGTACFTVDQATGQLLVSDSDTGNASARLEVDSTTQGFAPPRMTTAQKAAISTPLEGLVVYDTTLHALCFYNGTTWKTVATV